MTAKKDIERLIQQGYVSYWGSYYWTKDIHGNKICLGKTVEEANQTIIFRYSTIWGKIDLNFEPNPKIIRYHLINKLLENGNIWVEDGYYWGRAKSNYVFGKMGDRICLSKQDKTKRLAEFLTDSYHAINIQYIGSWNWGIEDSYWWYWAIIDNPHHQCKYGRLSNPVECQGAD